MDALSQQERTDLAKTAAAARWGHGRPEMHTVIRQMLDAVTKTGQTHRLYLRDGHLWHAEVGYLGEGHWMKYLVGTYPPGTLFSAVMDDVVEV